MTNEIVAVTGASGHIGANLIRSLLNQGRQVRVLEHLHNDAYKGLNVEIVKGNICDITSLNKLLKGVGIAYHLAAKIYLGNKKDTETENVNILGTKNIVDACLNYKIRRLIHFSSVHSLSPFPLNEIVDEKRALIINPLAQCYDFSKAAGEIEVLKAVKSGLNAVILNPCAVIGPHDYTPSPMGKLIWDLSQKKYSFICQGGFNWVDVRDVVDAALNAEKNGKRGEKYLLSGNWMSISGLANLISLLSKNRSYCFAIPTRLANFFAYFAEHYGRLIKTTPRFTSAAVSTLQHYRFISNEKAKKELNYSPRPLEETVIDTLSWHQSLKTKPLKVKSPVSSSEASNNRTD